MEVETSIEKIVSDIEEEILFYKLKQQQKDLIMQTVQKKHVFGLLPTGFGKSDCFGLISPILDKLHPEKPKHITLVVSPLRSLIIDQVKRWNQLGISTVGLMGDTSPQTELVIKNGDFSLLFASPEMICNSPWWDYIEQWKERVGLFAFDEVHCVTKWGTTFRPEYLEVPRLRVLLSQAPIMCLTATATQSMVTEILRVLHIPKADINLVAVLPDRPNIHLAIEEACDKYSYDEGLNWYAEQLKENGKNTDRAIIYCREIDEVTSIFGWLYEQLDAQAYATSEDTGDNFSAENRIFDFYHGNIDPDTQERIVSRFIDPKSTLRCVIATIAFGMGIQVKNVRYIIHWGAQKDILSYWQQVGRGGRDGLPSKAIMYLYPRTLNIRFVDEEVIALCKYVRDKKGCMRKKIIENLFVEGMCGDELENLCNVPCCLVCDDTKSIPEEEML